MSQGCALLILRSKGQRSRSWRMVIWKWFPGDNWLCNQPMIMKLHTLTPHESRMCPIDFGVKRSRSRSWRMVIWKWSTEIMVADLNLLGSVGDLYCFSNTFSMLLYVAPICCPSCFSCIYAHQIAYTLWKIIFLYYQYMCFRAFLNRILTFMQNLICICMLIEEISNN